MQLASPELRLGAVARPVRGKERKTTGAQNAIRAEWSRLRSLNDGKGAWDAEHVQEWADVRNVARKKQYEDTYPSFMYPMS